MFSYKLYYNNTSTLKLWPFDAQALMPGLQKILLGKIKILDNLLQFANSPAKVTH